MKIAHFRVVDKHERFRIIEADEFRYQGEFVAFWGDYQVSELAPVPERRLVAVLHRPQSIYPVFE